MTQPPESKPSDAEANPEDQDTAASIADSLKSFLDRPEEIRHRFEQLALEALSGRDVVPDLVEMLRIPHFITVAHLIRTPKEQLEEAIKKTGVADQQTAPLRELWSSFHQTLEPALDTAFDVSLDGIENTWTTINSKFLYNFERQLLMLDVELLRARVVIYRSVDRLESFLTLAMRLIERCESVLRQAVDHKLPLESTQSELISSRSRRLQQSVKRLSELSVVIESRLGEPEAPAGQTEHGG